MKKIFYILAIFIVSVVFIAPISASDNSTDALNYEISDLQSSDEGSFSDLYDLIQNTPKGETLILTKDYAFNNNSDFRHKEGIVLDFITIDGAGHSIDASAQARIFNTFNNVTLKNLKLVNGFGDVGGAIYSDTSLTCDNIIFENNSAKIIGGAIYGYYFSLENCTFNANHAANGSSVYLNNKVGMIDIPDTLINNCIFKNMNSNAIFINGTPKFTRISNITVLPILTAKDLEMTYKDGSKFEAKLVDGLGQALSGKIITFNINGVFYNRTTDENGIARLNINLMAGKYIITSMYSNYAAISNKITISS